MTKYRNIYPEIVKHLKRKEFTIITGARQTGKTTILMQLFKHLQKEGKKVWFITFEREDILRKIDKNPENIFQFAHRPENPLFKKQTFPFYFLIDEVQYAANPSNFLKLLYDSYSPNLKIIATGSSSFYLDTKFKDSLAGRKRIFTLRTLAFDEFLTFKDLHHLHSELEQIRNNSGYISLHFNELISLFSEYLLFGGYPEVVLTTERSDKIVILNEIKTAYIKRDIFESKVENQQKFYQLMILLSLQDGNLVNKFELSKSLKINSKTLEKYLYILQKCFHINLLKPFHKNLKKELLKMPKVYFNDLGLRNILIDNFISIDNRSDKGQLLENYVYLRLVNVYGQEAIRFWRTADKHEVDFVVKSSIEKHLAYEVKFSSVHLKKKKYNKFMETYPQIPISFVSFDIENDPNSFPAIKL